MTCTERFASSKPSMQSGHSSDQLEKLTSLSFFRDHDEDVTPPLCTGCLFKYRHENVSRRLRASDDFEGEHPARTENAHFRSIDRQFGGARANTGTTSSCRTRIATSCPTCIRSRSTAFEAGLSDRVIGQHGHGRFGRWMFSTEASTRRSMSFVARTKPWRTTAKPPTRSEFDTANWVGR